MSSHRRYADLLSVFRQDSAAWSGVAYREVRDAAGEWSDANHRVRFGVLRCLQFDLRPDDEELVRFLFVEETAARRAAPLQGLTWSLNLAGYLLATYRRPADLPLFWRAKAANFDTFCGFDHRYLLLLGGPDAYRAREAIDAGLGPETARDLLTVLTENATATPQEVADWWNEQQREYPAREEDEPPQRRFEAARDLGETAEARSWLDAWEATFPPEPEPYRHLGLLAYHRAQVGQFEEAFWAELASASRWAAEQNALGFEFVSRVLAAEYATKAGRFTDAFDLLVWATQTPDVREDRRALGSPLQVASALFDLAASASAAGQEDGTLGRRAFDAGDALLASRTGAYLVVLQKGEAAARAVGDGRAAERYAALARAEEQRTAREMARLRKGQDARRGP